MPSFPCHPDAIQRARLFIDEHYTQRLTLGEVARAVNLSPTYLCRAFKKANGCTLGAYVSRLRIEKAQGLLGDVELLVKEVAFLAGFRSIAHFNRVFKTAKGVPPLEYRRQVVARNGTGDS